MSDFFSEMCYTVDSSDRDAHTDRGDEMLIQTRDAKAAMRQAGFDSQDLRVRDAGDGDVSILCFAPLDEQISRMEAAVQAGLTVVVYQREDGTYTHPDYRWEGRAELIVRAL
jgi:hypothetical protein